VKHTRVPTWHGAGAGLARGCLVRGAGPLRAREALRVREAHRHWRGRGFYLLHLHFFSGQAQASFKLLSGGSRPRLGGRKHYW
jgi:hypothetical protein